MAPDASSVTSTSSASAKRDLEIESIDFFVRMMSLLGLPAPLVKYTGCSISARKLYRWIKLPLGLT